MSAYPSSHIIAFSMNMNPMDDPLDMFPSSYSLPLESTTRTSWASKAFSFATAYLRFCTWYMSHFGTLAVSSANRATQRIG